MRHIWRVMIEHHYQNNANFGLFCVSTKTVTVGTEGTLVSDVEHELTRLFHGDRVDVKQVEYIGRLLQ